MSFVSPCVWVACLERGWEGGEEEAEDDDDAPVRRAHDRRLLLSHAPFTPSRPPLPAQPSASAAVCRRVLLPWVYGRGRVSVSVL